MFVEPGGCLKEFEVGQVAYWLWAIFRCGVVCLHKSMLISELWGQGFLVGM